MNDDSESDTKEFDNLMNNLKLSYTTKSNLPEKKQETEATIAYNDQEQFKFSVVQDNNNYGIKSDEVVYKYLKLKMKIYVIFIQNWEFKIQKVYLINLIK